MRNCAQAAGLLLMVVVCLTLAGCGGATYATPDAAFKGMQTAAEKEDWKGICNCLTDDSRDMMAGGLAMSGMFAKMGGAFPDAKEEDKAKFKAIDDVMKKHGLTEEFLKSLPKDQDPGDKGGAKAAMQKMLEPVKDRNAFVADMMSAMKPLQKESSDQQMDAIKSAKLENLKVEGDSAKGEIVSQVKGKEKRDAVQFRKVSGSWKMEMPGMN